MWGTGAGRKLLAEVSDGAERAGFHWTAGWAQRRLARSITNHADPGSTTPHEALSLLERAVDNFSRMGEITFTLVAFLTTSAALTALRDLATAAQLRAAAHEHVRRLGLRTEVLESLSMTSPTEPPAMPTPHPDEQAAPDRPLSLRDMTALAFDRTR